MAGHPPKRLLTFRASVVTNFQGSPMNPPPTNPNEDITVFANHCVFVRSLFLHCKILFEISSDEDRAWMSRVAPVFFGDINRMLREYIILQVCKITDPARDVRKNDNHTIAFLLQHYDFSTAPATKRRLGQLDALLQAFREKLLPARNKIIAHSDRNTILAGRALGGAPQSEWDEFWRHLQELVCIVHEKVVGTALHINRVAMLSDADGLLKALKHGACFDQLVDEGDPALVRRCADLALG